MGIPIAGKDSIYIEAGPWICNIMYFYPSGSWAADTATEPWGSDNHPHSDESPQQPHLHTYKDTRHQPCNWGEVRDIWHVTLVAMLELIH